MFIIEDEWHAEHVAEFATRDEALAELQRLAALRWDEAPNAAPCIGWQTCGRRYAVVEYDDANTPWRELGRTPVLEVSQTGTNWLALLCAPPPIASRNVDHHENFSFRRHAGTMNYADHRTETLFVDRGDWPQAFVFLIFLIGFPTAFIAMLFEPRAVAPLKLLIPFAALFVAGAPFMLRLVLGARTREISVDNRTGVIEVMSKSLLRRSAEKIPPYAVHRLMFETTLDDGYWYQAILELRNSRQITFAQGSHEQAVRFELGKMAVALAATKPNLPTVEIRGRNA